MELAVASKYETPMQIIVEHVKPLRDHNRDKWLLANWWRPQRMRAEMRAAIAGLDRFLVTAITPATMTITQNMALARLEA
jgi:hypothetical protein